MSAVGITLFVLGAFILGMYVGTLWAIRETLGRMARVDPETITIARKALNDWEKESAKRKEA
jgi:hypothetical protein